MFCQENDPRYTIKFPSEEIKNNPNLKGKIGFYLIKIPVFENEWGFLFYRRANSNPNC